MQNSHFWRGLDGEDPVSRAPRRAAWSPLSARIHSEARNRGGAPVKMTRELCSGAADFDLELIESRTLDGNTQELTYRPTLHV